MSGRKWSTAEIDQLKAGYANTITADLARIIGRTTSSVNNMAVAIGLKKSHEHVAGLLKARAEKLVSLGLGRFCSGHETWNKGKRLPGHGDPRTFFKSGNVPHTHKPIGSTRLDKDGHVFVKVADTRVKRDDWKPAHVLAWIKAKGQIPRGHVVVFRPGMKTSILHEITVDRLECIDRVELMRRNSVHSKYPPEIAKLQQLRGVLTRQINKRAKEQRA